MPQHRSHTFFRKLHIDSIVPKVMQHIGKLLLQLTFSHEFAEFGVSVAASSPNPQVCIVAGVVIMSIEVFVRD